jgi:hypothetical protein
VVSGHDATIHFRASLDGGRPGSIGSMTFKSIRKETATRANAT